MQPSNPIEIPELTDSILTLLIKNITAINPNLSEGVYLTGSIPLNDFYSNKSDIDFVILCRNLPDEEDVKQLERIHKKIRNQFKRPKLSGVYLTREGLQVSNQQTIKVPSVFEGKMNKMLWGQGLRLTAVTLKELKTTALTICGLPAHNLPIEIKDEDLNRVLFENINSYWRNWLRKHSQFNHRYFLLVVLPWLTEWSVLGVARQLHTLKTGQITSKLHAGYYALEILPQKFHHIIQQAIKIRQRDKKLSHISPSIKRAKQTIECVRFVIEEFNRVYNSR